MIRFQHIEYLYALGVLPLFILVYVWNRMKRKKSLEVFGDTGLVRQLFPDISDVKPTWKFILFVSAYIFLIIGAANPQIGTKLEEVKREGVNIMIALDVSNSMRAEDLKPNRLDRAKQAITRMLDKLSNDRVGIIVFAGEAYLQLPLTNDYGAVKMFLSAIDPGVIPTQGTAVGAAVKLAMKSFNAEEKRYKTLIIITDGENHEDDAMKAVKDAREDGIIVHTIGMGSPEGTPIPTYAMGFQTGFRKDRTGNVILTKLNEQMLQELAAKGGGVYVRATNSEAGLNIVIDEIGKMEKKEFGTKVFTNFEDRFQYALGAALLLLICEFFLSDRRTEWWRKLNLFGHTNQTVKNIQNSSSSNVIGILFLFSLATVVHTPLWAQFANPRSTARSGNEAYSNGRFKEAETSYRDALKQDGRLTEGTFNLGDALYKQKKYDESADQFRLLADNSKAPTDVRSKSYYNLGNSYLQGKKLEEAVSAYKNSLRMNPSDEDARSNLAYAQQLLLQQQRQQQQNQDKQDKKDNQDQQQQQQNQNQNQNENKNQNQNQQQQQSQTQPKLSKADAERILDALNNDEKNIQKRLIKRKASGVVIEKDW